MTARVACVLPSAGDGDVPEARRRSVVGRIRALEGIDLVVLPELWPGGFFAFDDYARFAESLDGPTVTAVREVAAERGVHVAGGSFVERGEDGQLFNTAFLVGPDGSLLLTYRKIHTFGFRSREAELLSRGVDAGVAETPLGRIGLTVCYDLRFPELYRLLVDRGADLLVVPAAWPAARAEHWRTLLRARALENQANAIGCCGAGDDHGTALAGASAVVGPYGDVLAEAAPGDALLVADLDVRAPARAREEFPALTDRRLRLRWDEPALA